MESEEQRWANPLVGKVVPSEKIDSAINALEDIWAKEVLARPEGPTYENIKDYLPPLGAVNASFRYYPLVLSLIGSGTKFLFASNGAEVHASPNPWRLEGYRWRSWYRPDFKMSVLIGQDKEAFGKDLERITGPAYLNGYLPVVQIAYEHQGVLYSEEVFAAPALVHPEILACYVKITASPCENQEAEIALKFDCDTALKIRELGNRDLVALFGVQTACQFSHPAEFNEEDKTLTYRLDLSKGPRSAYLMLPSIPITPNHPEPLTPEAYEQVKQQTVAYWNGILDKGARFDVPEEIVNNAWRAMVIQTLMLVNKDSMHYSYANAYNRTYAGESLDAVMALACFGQSRRTRPLIEDINNYIQPGLEYHSNASLLCAYADHYLLFRDAEFIGKNIARILDGCEMIVEGRAKTEYGILPKEDYCGDISDKMYSLSANAQSWRALRDSAIVLEMLGRTHLSERYLSDSAAYRQAIVKAVEASMTKDADPPFVPIPLYEEAKPFEKISGSKHGSYYNLMMPYVIGTEVFPATDEMTDHIMRYLETRGGRLLGLVRFEDGIDDLYGLRYNIALIKRNEADKFLVAFYAKLAHGCTRNTFIDGEVTALRLEVQSMSPVARYFVGGDSPGLQTEQAPNLRMMGSPPNSTSNALVLQSLRYMLILECDSANDGIYDELHLLRATPRGWLADGKTISIKNAPTYFGPVSLDVRSRLADGFIEAGIRCPDRNPPGIVTLTLRLPDDYVIESVTIEGVAHQDFDAATGLVRLPVTSKTINLQAKCRR